MTTHGTRDTLPVLAILAGTAAAFFSLVLSADRVAACSLAPVDSRSLPGVVARTPIIAIGVWSESLDREATFTVEEPLKGTAAGARIAVDNRETHTAVACSPYDEPFRKGRRFGKGDRALVLLEKEVDGLWQVGWSSFAVYEVPHDDFAPLMMLGSGLTHEPPMPLAAALSTVRAAGGRPTDAETIERSLGCSSRSVFHVADIGEYTSIADAVALVTITGGPERVIPVELEPVQANVDELVRGTLSGSTITLNDRWISDYQRGNCDPTLELGRRGLRTGDRYLVFLRPDEFGIGEFRPVAWGAALVQVNERYLAGPWPTLGQLRSLTADEVLPVTTDAPPPARESGKDNAARTIGIVSVAILGAVAVALLVRRSRCVRRIAP